MPAADLSSYKVAASELSSSTKFNNLVQAIQDEFGDIDADQIPGYPSDTTKFLRGDGSWAAVASPLGLGPAVIYDRGGLFDLANSAVEQSLYSKSIAAGDLGTRRLLRLTMLCDVLYNNNVADTMQFKVKFGGSTLIDWTSGATGPSVLSATRKMLNIRIELANVDAANVQAVDGHWLWSTCFGSGGVITTGQGYAVAASVNAGASILGNGAIDTTLAQTLDITGKWSAASANDSLRVRSATLELL